MQKTRIYVAVALAAVTAGTAVAAVKLSDKFSTSVLKSMWMPYADGGTTLSPFGGALYAATDGSGTAAVVIEDYQLSSDSWKATVSARQVMAASALSGGASVSAFVGLQYGGLNGEAGLIDQANGYLLGVSMGDGLAYAGWSLYEDGVLTGNDVVPISTAKLMKGSISATYNSKKDRMSIVLGKVKRTFSYFMEDNPFFEDANPYLGANVVGDVSGTLFTFDNFSLTGKGVVQTP
jgi:hypothetical protein